MAPSPTAEATRLTLPDRTSPTAKTPGRFVSSIWGMSPARCPSGLATASRSRPVMMNPLWSSATQPRSHSVRGDAPAMMKRRLGTQLKVSHMMVARVWAKHGLKPQRLERYMASNDPDFEQKAADIIGLYLNPPAHAAVFCVDEKTAIQALDRKDPVLPLSPGRAERHGFEYFRHGTLSLYAAFDTKTGEVLGKTAAR